MARWLTFFKERFPIPVLCLIAFGIALSGATYPYQPLTLLYAVIACVFNFLFFSTLRLMDEIKDYEKDKIVHPTRPLPRGLISVSEIHKVMLSGLFGMVAIVALCYFFGRTLAGHWYSFTTLYLWLMYKEFYIGQALNKSPILYAITHQIIFLFMNAGAVMLTGPETYWAEAMLKPALIILGGFFTYEICRKLDPSAHPLLGTYRYHYGLKVTGVFSFLTLATAGFGAYITYGLAWPTFVLWAVEIITIVGFIVLAKEKYKLVELLASISLLTHIWLPTIAHSLRG